MKSIWNRLQDDPDLSDELKAMARELSSSMQCRAAQLDAEIFRVDHSVWPPKQAQQVAA